MASTYFPAGWELDVPNPGYGELFVRAPRHPFRGEPLVADEDWEAELYGPKVGEFLTQVTTHALTVESVAAPAGAMLPGFMSVQVARGLLPSLQEAVLLAVAGTDRHERTFRDADEGPARPLCVHCNEGTHFSPGALPCPWCEQHGHRAFGMNMRRWENAQEVYRLARWWAEKPAIERPGAN